ncbi:MAG: 50S ribosomal protein L9 [Phycisphaerales bacterium JB043]
MAKTIELLLVETVDNLGIVGDIVSVKLGYARNFLLPRGLATTPSEELVQELAAKRAEAEKQLAELRTLREQMIEKLQGFELHLKRACNDLGLLYGSVTQRDLAGALAEEGFNLRERDIRLPHTIKRIDTYEILIKPEVDLEATIKLWVVPDRELEADEKPEMEFDEEGNLIEVAPAGEEGEQPTEKKREIRVPAEASNL